MNEFFKLKEAFHIEPVDIVCEPVRRLSGPKRASHNG